MTGSLGDTGAGAAKGAALGAPLGPYGMATGAVVGGAYGYLSGGPSDAEKAAAAASAAHVANGKQNAIALENYRQSARDQYHRLLTAETTPYQAYSNRLAAGWGQGMSTAGLAANENPLTLRDTGVGAPTGSNYAGWWEDTPDATGRPMPTHHQGIGAYVNGTSTPLGSGMNPDGSYKVDAHGARTGATVDADPLQVAQFQDMSRNPTYQPSSMGLQPGGGAPAPGAGLRFAPRRAP